MISIVIPALNEQNAIGETVTTIKNVLAAAGEIPFEIIVVDDGSSDDTGKIAAASGATVVRHPHNAGYGRSLKDGIRTAQGETIVISDADGTYPINKIPELLRRHREGFDMTVGARSGSHYRESLMKMPLRWILRKLVEFTAARDVPDINSGLRVFNRSQVIPYFDHLCDTFSFTTSLTLAYMMTGRFVAYETIDYHKRIGQTKVKLLRDAFRTFQYILEAAIYFNPLRIFILLSGVVLIAGLISFAAALVLHINLFYFLGIGACIASLLILSLGLLAVLLRQIMINSEPTRTVFGSGLRTVNKAVSSMRASSTKVPGPFAKSEQ